MSFWSWEHSHPQTVVERGSTTQQSSHRSLESRSWTWLSNFPVCQCSGLLSFPWSWFQKLWSRTLLKTGLSKSAALHTPANLKTQQWPQDWKRSVFIPIPKKGNAKECSNYHTIALISHASKVMLKILQARLQQYVNRELPDVQVGLRKGRGTRDQIANIRWIIEKAREFQKKHLFLLYWLCQSLWLCGSQ